MVLDGSGVSDVGDFEVVCLLLDVAGVFGSGAF